MKKLINNKRIGIIIIAVLLLGCIAAAGAKISNEKLLKSINSVGPNTNKSISVLGGLIVKGEGAYTLQQELEGVVSKSDQIGDLLIIKQDTTIIAAKDRTAVGMAFPIVFKTNIVKGIPLPFAYNKTDSSNRDPSELYQLNLYPAQMFKLFGKYQAPDNQYYYIVGTHLVSPDLLARQERIMQLVSVLLMIYRICFILFWLLLAAWVYQDARKRPVNAAAWGILTLFTSVIGWVVYLIARPIIIECPSCGIEQNNNLKFCTCCGGALKICCPVCGNELQATWAFCGVCGKNLADK